MDSSNQENNGSNESSGSINPEQLAYVEKHVIPWLTEHLKMRAVGFQVFPAVQATIFIAYGNVKHHAIPFFGIGVCIAFLLWDVRNILIFRRLHQVAWDICEKFVLDGRSDGVHGGALTIIDQGLGRSNVLEEPRSRSQIAQGILFNLGSHTVAIMLMIVMAIGVWTVILYSGVPGK